MKTILGLFTVILLAQSLGACALIGGVAIGVGVEHEHQQWCYSHPYDSHCR